MAQSEQQKNVRTQDRFLAVPISEEQSCAALQVCAVLDHAAEEPRFVVLRETLDARVLLGCVIDETKQVHRWLELWIQDISGFAGTPMAGRAMLNNHLLDQRWKRRCAALGGCGGAEVIRGVWERVHPLPVVIDKEAGVAEHPVDAEARKSGGAGRWCLCEDDDLLTQHGLPAYSASLHRYLYVNRESGPIFAAITDGAPTSDATIALDSVHGERLAMNIGGGLMMIRTHEPLSFDQYIDLLGGAKLSTRSTAALFNGQLSSIEQATGESVRGSGRLFLGRHGRSARLLETFHLKLRAIADAVAATRQFVKGVQAPVLDLRGDRFRVRPGPAGSGLPSLWTAQVVLADPAEAVPVPFEATAHRYFLPQDSGASIYKVSASTRSIQGRGSMRLREIIGDGEGGSILEGTFATHERIEPASGDLLWMRLPVGGDRMDVHATLDAKSALAAGEWRFRTHARKFDERQRELLKQIEGVPVDNVLFDLVPLLSSPCDLYSLAVLATRTLLVDDDATLAVAMDEVLSLARQLAGQYDESAGIALRIRAIFDEDDRFATGIGPQRLVREALTPAEAFDAVPMELWFETLAMIVRALPGVSGGGPDSFCQNLGDVSPGALEAAFDGMLEDLDLLIERTRCLITADWRANREIHAVARQLIGSTETVKG